MAYQLNDVPRFTGTFKNASAVLTDPTAVTFTYTTPAGVATTLTYGTDVAVVKSSTGVYYVDLALSATGRWSVVWRGTGTVADSDETDIVVGVSDAYCTLEELKDELGLTGTTDDDPRLQRSINAASRQFDGWCGQRFWQDAVATAREFYCDGPDCVNLLDADPADGISTTTGLIVKTDSGGDGTFATTLAVGTDFLLLPRNAATGYPVRPYTELRAGLSNSSGYFPRGYGPRAGVQITAKWGWPAVPDDVNKACLVQAAQLYKAKDTAFDVAGSNDFGAIRVRSGMNRTAEALLAAYRLPAVG